MNKDTLKGGFEQAKGEAKKAAGGALGDRSTSAEGTVQKVVGAVQKNAGQIKDKVEEVAKSFKK